MSHPHGEQPEPAQVASPAMVPPQPLAPPVEQVVTPLPPTAQFPIGSAPVTYPEQEMPISAVPYGYGVPVAPPKKSRAGIITLSLATGLLALVAAGMTTLYFVEHTERAAADKLVAEQKTAIEAHEKSIKDLDADLKSSKEELAKLNQDLTGSKNKTDEVTKEKEALAGCFRAIEIWARSQSSTNRKAMEKACDEASKYY